MKTPLINAENLAKQLGLPALYFKREDLHPYGSHKGRSIPKMIEKYTTEGICDFVISSSGNAALAAALFIKEHNEKNPTNKLNLKIYIGYRIDKEKLARLLQVTRLPLLQKIKNLFKGIKPEIKIHQTLNPRQSAFLAEKNNKGKNLRQSTDDTALLGYEDLSNELSQIPNLEAIFIPTSSGTTAQGLYLGFNKKNLKPKIYPVQTTACHPFAQNPIPEDPSLAKAIVDKIARRKPQIEKITKNNLGKVLIITNSELLEAEKIYLSHFPNEKPSYNSLLSLSGLLQEIKNGTVFTGAVICLFTGK
ncbi:MAG TPA: PLP-dependent lyase/thiolase [Candidatus Magasanikbacteria bacterium]|nr:PLP-dependent lyase/thiolase [Candidatus Magasanikbacteria bacterium]